MSRAVGILGGSFDPPHVGHTTMAVTARDKLGLDVVLLVPAPRPPHKDPGGVGAWEHRVAMTRLAAAGLDGVDVSLHETGIAGESYTVDSLRRYRELYDDDVYFILGADSLRDLPGWKEPRTILALATLVVFPREGIDARLAVPGEAGVVVFERPTIDVSSSDIRKRWLSGESIEPFVPPAVFGYIRDHSLYAG